VGTPEILTKLTDLLRRGISSEVEVVYLLAALRKLLERDERQRQFSALNFYCNWALHALLDRRDAQDVLRLFDAAHGLMKEAGRTNLDALPEGLRDDILRISRMDAFREQVTKILEIYDLPPLTLHSSDGWTRFVHLYANVVQDIPLVVTGDNARHLADVTVKCEVPASTISGAGDEIVFFITWLLHDRDSSTTAIRVVNTVRTAEMRS
jgi:hypothetical protein